MKKLRSCNAYGVWNAVTKEFQFGIKTDTPAQAEKALNARIGKDANKWRLEVQSMNNGKLIGEHNNTQISKYCFKIKEAEKHVEYLKKKLEEFKNE